MNMAVRSFVIVGEEGRGGGGDGDGQPQKIKHCLKRPKALLPKNEKLKFGRK